MALFSSRTVYDLKPLHLAANLWEIDLTAKGKESIQGTPYAHKQEGDCDEWQVTVPLSKFDHFEITGILEEGPHADVQVSSFYNLTPVALEVKQVAPRIVHDIEAKQYGRLADDGWVDSSIERLLGGDIAKQPPGRKTFTSAVVCKFDKFDDVFRFGVKWREERSPLVSIPPLWGGDFQGMRVYQSDVSFG